MVAMMQLVPEVMPLSILEIETNVETLPAVDADGQTTQRELPLEVMSSKVVNVIVLKCVRTQGLRLEVMLQYDLDQMEMARMEVHSFQVVTSVVLFHQ